MAMDLTISGQSSMLFTILGFLLFLYAIFYLFTSRRNKTAARKPPPEVGGAWPVIGHLHLLGGPQPPHITLGNMADKYGPIFTVRLGVHPTLIVSSWEIAKECFTVNDKAFAGRPKLVAFEVMGYNFAMFGLSSYGSYWRHVRKIATVEVLSNHRLGMLKHVRESEVKSAIKDTYSRWVESNNDSSQNSQSVPLSSEMKKWFGDITLNVVLRMVVGIRFAEIDRIETTRKALREFFSLSGSFVISDAVPFLRWLDLGGQEKAMKKTAKELDQFLQFWLDEHKRNRDSGSGQAEPKHGDFMDVLLSVIDEAEMIDGHDAPTMIKATSLVSPSHIPLILLIHIQFSTFQFLLLCYDLLISFIFCQDACICV